MASPYHRKLDKLPHNTIIQIASSVWKAGSRDIRDVLKIAKLCNPADTEEDISRLISIHQSIVKLVWNIINLHYVRLFQFQFQMTAIGLNIRNEQNKHTCFPEFLISGATVSLCHIILLTKSTITAYHDDNNIVKISQFKVTVPAY
jgi:hypothetical protein